MQADRRGPGSGRRGQGPGAGDLRIVRPAAVGSSVFKHALRVRYSECDPQGVVFNANYVAYLDVIITELWREALGRYDDLVESGTDMVVAEVNVRFLGPAGFDDVVDFEARLTRIGETAISTRIDASTGGRPVIEAHMRHVFIDANTKAKCAMPGHVRDALAVYLDQDAGTLDSDGGSG